MATPHYILRAQLAEQQRAGNLEHSAEILLAECRTLLEVHPWQTLEFRAAVCGAEDALQRLQEAQQHRANVEAEYQRVQQAEDARIGWTIACEEVAS